MTKSHAFILVSMLTLLQAAPAVAQKKLTGDEYISSLEKIGTIEQIDIDAIRAKAVDSAARNRTPEEVAQEPLSSELQRLSQFTVNIEFQLNSAAILPQSFRLVGAMADALRHPTLLEYKFLIVGHTDTTGNRTSNLELSQKRADAIRDALVTTFGISPDRVFSIGLGQEQLLDPKKPTSPANRRVQLINIGRYRS
ncbi:OmpA family protein [Prosthecomicrobium sp. N25]|uniref:OmpA family protein n=1 Tax=Prosthecomicrobium sp. N25 TaxID=3129254 RepID=UPI0030787A68